MRLFQRQSAPEVYADLVTGAKERIAEYERGIHFWPVWNDDLTKIANRIKERDLESYVRSRFLASLLGAMGDLQRKAIRKHDMLEISGVPMNELPGERAVFEELLDDLDLEESTNLFGGPIVMLARDPDVDLKVAEDLDRAASYPRREPLPPAENTESFFPAAAKRVSAFAAAVLGISVSPPVTSRSPETGSRESSAARRVRARRS